MDHITRHVKITGRVQGVGFRYSLCDEALQKKVAGWVRNSEDGSVEAILQGSEESVLELIEWSKKGPGSARVEKVDVSEGAGDFNDFEIRP